MTEPPFRDYDASTTQEPKREGGKLLTYVIILIIVVAASLIAMAVNAMAHEAASGFIYPGYCCSGIDCREIPASAISEQPDGLHLPSGEVVGYHDTRIKDSPDGQTHWCSQGGSDTGKTICLFLPPRAF